MSWQPIISDNEPETVLATGFSCRSQVKRYEKFKPKHPLQIIAELL